MYTLQTLGKYREAEDQPKKGYKWSQIHKTRDSEQPLQKKNLKHLRATNGKKKGRKK